MSFDRIRALYGSARASMDWKDFCLMAQLTFGASVMFMLCFWWVSMPNSGGSWVGFIVTMMVLIMAWMHTCTLGLRVFREARSFASFNARHGRRGETNVPFLCMCGVMIIVLALIGFTDIM